MGKLAAWCQQRSGTNMLQDIRDNSQGVIAKVIIGLIVAVFVLFGADSIIGGFVSAPPVAEVNGEEIYEAQLQASTQTLLNSIGGGIDSFDQGLLEQIALNQLIEEIILRQSTQNAAMSVSSNRIDRAIIETEGFQIGGVFDSDLAIRTMASQGFSVPYYRETLRQQMLVAQIANAYSSSNFVTESELARNAELSEQTRDFRYLSVVLGARTLGTAISDEEIETYYNENQAEFSEDETVNISYVLLDKNRIAEEIEVDEADLLARYEEERGDFEGSAEKRASHIMFEVNADLSEEQALQQASDALQRIAAGEDFATLALELSSDGVSAEEGGDIGYSDGTAFPPALEAALEILMVDEVSDPVISEFGVHLVKLTEDSENIYQSFAEVSARMEREMKSAEVELIFGERQENLSNLAFETGDLLTISEELNLEIRESEAFGRIGGVGLFASRALISAAFSDDVLLEGNNSDVIEVSESEALVLRVQQFNEASVTPIADVQAEIAVIIRIQMERDAVLSLGDELLTATEAGTELDTLLAENELEWIDAVEVGRSVISVNREILNEVFAMPVPDTATERTSLTLANGTFILLELDKVSPGSLESMATDRRSGMTNALLVGLGNSDFQAFLTNLRNNADIRTQTVEEEF